MRIATQLITFAAISVALSVISGCASHAVTPAEVSEPVVWGASENVTRLRHLYFSDQPDAEALRIAKENGVTTVINLREPSEELDWDEQAEAKRLGLKYLSIPVSRKADSLNSQAMTAISAAVRQQAGDPVLLHCSSGNRAAAWLAVHLVEDHGTSQQLAIDVAREAGLTYEPLVERVQTYLGNR